MSALENEKLSSLLAESNRKMEIFRKVSFELNKLVSLPEKLQTILAILDEQFGMANSLILFRTMTNKCLPFLQDMGMTRP